MINIFVRAGVSMGEIEKDLEDLFAAMGFKEYEIKMYSVLLSNRVMDAKGIAKATGIPLTKIYSVAQTLASKGLIGIVPGNPTRFELLDPKVGFEHLLKDLESKKEKLEKTMEGIQKIYEEGMRKEEDILTFSNLQALQKQLIELDKKTEKSICIFSKFRHAHKTPEFMDTLEEIIDKGVKVRVIGAIYNDTSKLSAYTYKKVGCDVRVLPKEYHANITITIFDEKIVSIIIESETNPNNFTSVLINNENTAKFFKNMFEYYWSIGKRLS